MNRITKRQSEILNKHLIAKQNSTEEKSGFDHALIPRHTEGERQYDVKELIEQLKRGETNEEFFDYIESRFASIGAMMINRFGDGYRSQNYMKDLRKGFRIILTKYGIV
jgi:hypothetical protein